MAKQPKGSNSNTQLLQELDALSQTLYQSHTARRTASLAIPRSSAPTPDALPTIAPADPDHIRPRSRRMSMSPFRSRPKSHRNPDNDQDSDHHHHVTSKIQQPTPLVRTAVEEKKGIWNWKPMRALSHIGMQRLGCLFSVEMVAAQGLPPSMNGLRLSVTVRKKETKDGAVQTMPARVLQGSADFEETLFIRCHVYCNASASAGKPIKFEPRLFLISTIAIDAPELDFGRSTVDLSLLIKDSMEKSLDGTRVRQWDVTFPLAGKAKGGELVLKLGFQIMEDGDVGIYNQVEGSKSSNTIKDTSSPFARRHSKSSFSVTSPRITRSESPSISSKELSAMDLKEIDNFNLDEPAPPPSIQKQEPETKDDDQDLPDFDVVDKGIEITAGGEVEAAGSEEATDVASVSSEVVKEVVHDSGHLIRLTELDAIAKQIKALESMMTGDKPDALKETTQEDEVQRLDAEEETVTREFLQMLELEDGSEPKYSIPDVVAQLGAEGKDGGDTRCFISDLGKGLGSVVQTRDGGYLAAMNPLDVEVGRKETPKLAMQISRPLILQDQKQASGFEVFQKLAGMGSEELGSKLLSLTEMDELIGKTAEQIAFEGIASAIITGRNKEGASSSAARSVAILKTMAAAMSDGRKERILSGIWNVKEEPVVMEEILAFSLQKIEAMAVDALKVQAGVAEEEAPFEVSPLTTKESSHTLDSAISPEDWEKDCIGATAVTLLVVVQLRDPMRRYEAVGAPVIAVVQAGSLNGGGGKEEGKFKVTSLHVGGVRLRSGGRRSAWDGEKQRLTAMQWLVAYGLGKAGRKSKPAQVKGGKDLVWSLSSRVMADMWLKPIRNPDVKVPEQL